jgi:hypothetical protein
VNASLYPVEINEEPKSVKTSVRLPRDRHDDIRLIAELWTEMDAQLQRKKHGKDGWKPASVIERFVAVAIDSFWQQYGGRPENKESRAEFIRKAISAIKHHKK